MDLRVENRMYSIYHFFAHLYRNRGIDWSGFLGLTTFPSTSNCCHTRAEESFPISLFV